MSRPPGRTAVYRLYDDAGDLLYVGVAKNPPARWKYHARHKAWWQEVADREICWHADRDAALRAEAAAIRAEQPRYNAVIPHPDGSLRGCSVRTDTPAIARGSAPSGYKQFRMDDDLWQRFGAAVKSADPDANCSRALRQYARWFVGDIDQEPRRPAIA